MKKRLLTICAVLGVILALAGCGSSASSDIRTEMTTSKSTDAGGGAAAQYEGAAAYDTAAEIGDMAAEENGVAAETSDAIASESNTDSPNEALPEPEAGEEASNGQKLIKTVNMTVETTAFDELITGLKTSTEQSGGYVESSEMSTSSGEYASRWAYLVLRIPAGQLEEFVQQVGKDANVTYSSESTEDVTLTYVDMESHLAALRTEQESLMSMLEKAESLEDILTIQSQLTQVRYEIESYESRLRVYDNQVDYSTVYINVNEVVRETSAAGTTFGESVKTRFGDNLYLVGRGFRNFAIGFLGAIPILVVLAAIIAVIIAVIFFACRAAGKIRRKRLEKKRNERQ